MLNKAQIIGRVGKDPEVRHLSNGDAVANLSLATSESWKDKNTGEKKEATEWHRVTFYGRLAEVVGEYVKKGGLLYVEGKIKTRKWTDKDGVERYTTEIHGNEMKMLGGKSESSDGQSEHQEQKSNGYQPQQARQSVADLDDDIPF